MPLFNPFYCLKSPIFGVKNVLLVGGFAALQISRRLLLLTGGYSKHLGRPTDQSKTSPTDRQLFRALRRTTDQSKTSPIGSRLSRALCRPISLRLPLQTLSKNYWACWH